MVDERHRSPGSGRSTAVLDDAHVGDIRGAFGTIAEQERGERRTWRRRLLALAVIMGPGLIVMVGDNDAGGVATYAQAGQNYGTSLLWVLVLLVPVLIVNQEMVVRLGAVTGVGHGRLIYERFGKSGDGSRSATYSCSTSSPSSPNSSASGLAPPTSAVADTSLCHSARVAPDRHHGHGSFRRWERQCSFSSPSRCC